MMNENQWGIPSTQIRVVPNETVNSFYRISVIEHLELNLSNDPCEEDEDYDYRACVKESLAKKVGCRPSWDRWSDQRRNICTQLHQHRWFFFPRFS